MASSKSPTYNQNSSHGSELNEFFAFSKSTLAIDIASIFSLSGASQSDILQHLLFFGTHLYWTPAPELSLKGLPILRPGVHLGEIKPGRFQPGQALAFALAPKHVKYYLSLTPSDPKVKQYLRGESWEEQGPDGWLLVGVDQFPLGWAKRVQGQIKNHYAKELRLRI